MKAKRKHAHPIKDLWAGIVSCYREFKAGLADKAPRHKTAKSYPRKAKAVTPKTLTATMRVVKATVKNNPQGPSPRELLRSGLSKELREKTGLAIDEIASKALDDKPDGPLAVLTNGKILLWNGENKSFTIS
ncbi:MAG: hypothetical protein ABSE63_11735 [Thermoguttaceae bacterium]|jgi:hypothetical protein